MGPKFSNKKIVLTGGNRGIGKAIALSFAEQGADIVITYNSDSKAADIVINEIRKFGVKAKAIQVDLINDDDRGRLLKESYEFLGDVDILINNAGIATRKPFLDLSQDEVTKIFTVNLLAPFFIMQAFAQRMASKQNELLKDYCIINITSISREVITHGLSHYEASKAALSQLTKSASIDLSRYKIRVNDVAPGLVPTDINRSQWDTNSAIWQNRVAGIPLNRPGTPDEIAQAVLFLADNKWITGSTITVDGGKTCNWYGAEINNKGN